MSIVSTVQAPAQGRDALLEVAVVPERDVAGADEGGADRLFLLDAPTTGGLSPEPAQVSAVCRETELPVRVILRLNDSYTTTGGELTRLVGLAEDYLAGGAEGLAFGFLDSDLEIDAEVCEHLADSLPGVPWTFHRAVDAALSADHAWRALRELPGLDSVISAGSVRDVDAGLDELTARAASDPFAASVLMAGGGLRGEHVPWLMRAGISGFHVGSSVRPGGSWTKAYVDPAHVRSWRLLLDDALAHLRSRPAG
jgi:copper homeostasis protein